VLIPKNQIIEENAMKTVIKSAAVLAALILALLICGCTGKTGDAAENNNNINDGMVQAMRKITEYKIIRGDSCEKYVTEGAVFLNKALSRLTGTEIAIATDWEKGADESEIASRKEILVGMTNRQESKSAYSALEGDDYIVRADGNKIVIAASGEAALDEAIKNFLGNYLGYSKLDVSAQRANEFAMTGAHNVKTYGAAGDGTTDDTEAFKAAVAAAEADGLPVYVPGGKYLVTDTIELNSVTLYGYPTGAWTADSCDLPIVLHSNMTVPLFDVRSGALSGLHIECAYKKEGEKAATVMITGTGGRVTDMTIRNPHIGIMCDDKSNPGRCYIGNIFIVQAWEMGVYVAGTYDVPIIENVEVWNNGETGKVGFRFAHNDDIRAVNLFAFNVNTGFLINRSETGAFWGSLTNCSVDFTSIGIKIEGEGHHIAITGGCWWVHHRVLSVESGAAGNISMTGCEMKSNGEPAVCISGGTMVTVSGCNIERTFNGGDVPAVRVSGGKMVNITGNTIYSRNDGVALSGRGNIYGVSGNIIYCGGQPVRDTSTDCTTNDYMAQNTIKTGLVLED
jgi:hypothetical protein